MIIFSACLFFIGALFCLKYFFFPLGATVTGEQIPILMYHHLAPAGTYDGTGNETNGAIITMEAFEEQMAYLAEENYQTLFMSELTELLEAKEALPEKTVVITFDDGYESNYRYAYPILQKYGLKATIHVVVSSSIGMEAPAVYDPQELTHLSFDQMREMVESGCIEIQSHSFDSHKTVATNANGEQGYALTNRAYLPAEQRKESAEEYLQRITEDVVKAKTVLEEELAVKISCFAYPYGAATDSLKEALRQAGYQSAVIVRSGLVQADSDIMALPRITILPEDDLHSFAEKIAS